MNAMPHHYLSYWRWDTVQTQFTQPEKLDHIASGQAGRMSIGDIVWVSTVKDGRLFLIGKVKIDQIITYDEAKHRLGTNDLYDAEWHILANKDEAEYSGFVEITEIAEDLRFISDTGKDRLTLTNKGVSAQQLQTTRVLTSESAVLLSNKWYGNSSLPENVLDYIETAEDFFAYSEGQVIERTRLERQRSHAVVTKAKENFREKHGHLFCEVCGFDFTKVYGVDYAEAHHNVPISQRDIDGETTKTQDLSMLCANCHRVVHLTNPPLDIEELKKQLKQRWK